MMKMQERKGGKDFRQEKSLQKGFLASYAWSE